MKAIIIPILLFLFFAEVLFAQQDESAKAPQVLNESGEQFPSEEEALKALEKAKLSEQKALAEEARSDARKLGLGLSLSQAVALKSQQIDNSELKMLLAKEAYEIHQGSKGQPNDPVIFEALMAAVTLPQAANSSSGLDIALEQLLAKHRYDPTGPNANSPFFALTAHGAQVEVPWALDIHASKNELAFSVNGWNQGYFEWWDSEKKQLLHKIDAHNGEQVLALVIHPSLAGVYSAGADHKISYTTKEGTSKVLIEDLAFKVTDLAISGNGGHVAATGDVDVHIWNTETRDEEFILSNPYNNLASSKLGISPAGRFVVVSYVDGTVLFWDMHELINKSDYQPTLFKHPGIQITAITFSPNGEHVLMTTSSQQALLWQVVDADYKNYENEREFPFKSMNYQPLDLKKISIKKGFPIPFFLNKNQFFIQSFLGEKAVFYTRMETYADYICEKVCKNLSDEEWLEYIGNDFTQEGKIYLQTFKGDRTPDSTCPSCPQRP